MKNTIKTRCLNLLLGILILAGCSNPALEQTETPAIAGTGAVSVRIGTVEGQFKDAARTLAPELPAFSKYTLTFSGPEAQDPVDISSGTSASVELTVGTWTITATAYTGTTPIAQGNAEVKVNAESKTPADIILAPISEAPGKFSYSIDVPANATGSLVIVKADGSSVVNGTIDLEVGPNSAELDFHSGQYLMSVRLTMPDGKAAGRTEAVHIYPSRTTEVKYSFAEYDFEMVVPLSNNIPVTGTIATSRNVQWYSFTAAEGSSYQVQWNTSLTNPEESTITLPSANVSAFKADGSDIFKEESDTPQTVSGVIGTVYLKVKGQDTGTYTIKYTKNNL
jgi:hypothetical protein